MAGRFLIKDIALQAGVGVATVDRVLKGRGGVRAQTARRVRHAIEELEQQEEQIGLTGRKFIIDLVIEAPENFTASLARALASELPLLRPAVFRARSDMRLDFPEAEIERALDRIGRRGSHGVILMAPDSRPVNDAVDRLTQAGIPVVAFATDLPRSRRIAYTGMDNRRAGETAAYLVRQWLAIERPHILITIRNSRFRGEEDREIGFRNHFRQFVPQPQFTELIEGGGTDHPIGEQVRQAISAGPNVDAVYSIGGSNRDILAALKELGHTAGVFVAHDLDAENRALLRGGKLSAVLDHDFRADIRDACKAFMVHHRALAAGEATFASDIRVFLPPMVAG